MFMEKESRLSTKRTLGLAAGGTEVAARDSSIAKG
eukprot:CAMPEP_0171812212 /NCGR_PEP_ID=MMETSP0991-20121206/78564_1 /TAXON_ID=483369 /ORGANISM="non described non described, Strain CCMP2098" /LENGTH=34 /DNA_ID= /DNA_START= /DNA_END= /DNA_ORIENTATION=